MSESEESPRAAAAAGAGEIDAVRRAWESLSRDLLGEPEYSALDLSERSGASPELLSRLWQNLGFPPVAAEDRMFTATDVATVRSLVNLPNGASSEALLVQLTRMAGQTQARLAAALAEMIGEGAAPGESGVDLIARNAPLVKSLEPLVSYVWRRHLLAALGRHLVARDGAAGGMLVVGFADLVAFTSLTRRLQDARLASVVERFEALVYAHVPGNRGRIVKFLGDEVLFVADTPADAAAIALGLVESIAADPDLPEIRVGLALGPVVALGGDVFGQTVNLASRLVDEARPSTILVAEEVGAALGEVADFAVQRLRGRLNLKGIGRVHACVLRRPKAEPENEEKKKVRKDEKRAAKRKKDRNHRDADT